jgi:hypothetical protein
MEVYIFRTNKLNSTLYKICTKMEQKKILLQKSLQQTYMPMK